MIKIKRSECPKVLRNSPSKGTHYNKSKVVKTLWRMQHEKCCYCEQYIPDKGHLKAVEHFRPKSVFRYLTNDWQNLLLACAQCNGKKSNKFPEELTDNLDEPKVLYLRLNHRGRPLIIDPSDLDTDPEEHIDFIVDDTDDECGIIKAKDYIGRTTIKEIGLRDYFYTKKRWDHYFNTLLPSYTTLLMARRNRQDETVNSYKDRFKMWMSARGEFAAFVRAFARYKKLDTRFGIPIPLGAAT